MNNPVEAVIAAAGPASRMITWKPILPWRGSTVIETVVDTALECCSRVIVVVGHRADELRSLLAGRPRVLVRRNSLYHEGQFSSVQVGLSAVSSRLFFMMLGDMPLVGVDTYRGLMEAWRDDLDALRPAWKGQPGHPVLAHRKIIHKALSASARSSMRDLLAGLRLGTIEAKDDSVCVDLDTQEDYERLSERLQTGES
jgi:molybdenum cofactor cytidylyltransferase